jgi:hypothetical protein
VAPAMRASSRAHAKAASHVTTTTTITSGHLSSRNQSRGFK